MEYQASKSSLEENVASTDLDLIEESSEFEETSPPLKELDQKGKGRQASKRSLVVRRAIEDHLEAKRMRKEVDYMFDEHFTDEDEKKE